MVANPFEQTLHHSSFLLDSSSPDTTTAMLFNIPPAVLTDSYKTTHPFIFPKAQRMVAYGEMRQAYDKDPHDNRIVFYGIRYM